MQSLGPLGRQGDLWWVSGEGSCLCDASSSPGSPWRVTGGQPKVRKPRVNGIFLQSEVTKKNEPKNMFLLPHLRV